MIPRKLSFVLVLLATVASYSPLDAATPFCSFSEINTLSPIRNSEEIKKEVTRFLKRRVYERFARTNSKTASTALRRFLEELERQPQQWQSNPSYTLAWVLSTSDPKQSLFDVCAAGLKLELPSSVEQKAAFLHLVAAGAFVLKVLGPQQFKKTSTTIAAASSALGFGLNAYDHLQKLRLERALGLKRGHRSPFDYLPVFTSLSLAGLYPLGVYKSGLFGSIALQKEGFHKLLQFDSFEGFAAFVISFFASLGSTYSKMVEGGLNPLKEPYFYVDFAVLTLGALIDGHVSDSFRSSMGLFIGRVLSGVFLLAMVDNSIQALNTLWKKRPRDFKLLNFALQFLPFKLVLKALEKSIVNMQAYILVKTITFFRIGVIPAGVFAKTSFVAVYSTWQITINNFVNSMWVDALTHDKSLLQALSSLRLNDAFFVPRSTEKESVEQKLEKLRDAYHSPEVIHGK